MPTDWPVPVMSSPFGLVWLSELQSLLLGTETLLGFLEQLAQLTARALPEGSSCGLTARQDSGPVTLAASDDWTSRLTDCSTTSVRVLAWRPWRPGRTTTSLIPVPRCGGRVCAGPLRSRVCVRVWRCR
jgi:hypothetical protein